MGCPFVGIATRYTVSDELVSVRICSAVPYERDSDPEDLPLPSVCFSRQAWQSCPHYLRLTQRREIARMLGLPGAPDEVPGDAGSEGGEGLPAFERRAQPDPTPTS